MKIITPPYYNKYRNIEWNISYKCNYNCSYCFVNESKNIYAQELSYNSILLGLNNLKYFSQIDRLKFCGGEPTIFQNFQDIFYKACKELPNTKIGIATNFSQNKNWFQNLLNKTYDFKDRIFFDISYHLEFSNINDFIDKLELLNEFDVTILLMAHPNKFEECKRIYQELNKLENLKIKITIVDTDWKKNANKFKPYSPEYKKFILDNRQKAGINDNVLFINGNEQILKTYSMAYLKLYKLNNFKGYKCKYMYNLIVDPNGTIHTRCYSYLTDDKLKPYNNIVNKNTIINLEKKWEDVIICEWDVCNCPGNIRAPKFGENHE